MSTRPRFIACLATGLALLGCQELPTETGPATTPAGLEAAYAPGLDALALHRPVRSLPVQVTIVDDLSDVARRAIDPADYVCAPSTAISQFINAQVDELLAQEPAITFELLLDLAADFVVFADAVLFQTADDPQEFGYDGQFTNALNRAERSVKNFWDVPSDDIQMVAMKGSILTDVARVTLVYQALGVPLVFAQLFAERVAELLELSVLFNGGNHPVLSFNAFAIDGVPAKIVMGDGIMHAYEDLGLGDVAPQAIYAHEFAHHIQFLNGYFDDEIVADGDPAERTRYTELMADALSAYYLSHKRGATMNQKRVVQFLEVFFEIGDCSFSSPGHHGTPNQRMAAAQFGFAIADATQKKGKVLTADEFHDLFVAFYPTLIAPDV